MTYALIIAVLIFLNFSVFAQSAGVHNAQNHLPNVLDTPVEFNGWESEFESLGKLHEIRVGIFVSDDPDDAASRSVYNGAELAVSEFNAVGGYHGLPYRLVGRWESDPWKAGSKELINLVYRDSVVAIIGSTNGNSTHIAEQIVTKAWIPLLSPISADPTLNHIRIPWMFRLPPGYSAQAQIIVKKCCSELLFEKVGIVTSTDHDGRIFAQEIHNSLTGANIVPLFHFQVPSNTVNLEEIIRRAEYFKIKALIIYLEPTDLQKLLAEWPGRLKSIAIFIPWIPVLQEKDLQQYNNCDIYYTHPFSEQTSPLYMSFQKNYSLRFGEDPSPAAAYAYDALSLLNYALKKSAPNRRHIRTVLAGIKSLQGVTGNISWDNAGGNTSLPVITYVNWKNTH